jgi:protein-S-isoprenylcysteine O-methyltransferase Ste14
MARREEAVSPTKLTTQTLLSAVGGVILLGALLFIPAGTLDYWHAWVFIVVFVASTQVIGIYLTLKDPALLERRKKFGPTAEQRPAQRIVISLGILSFLGVLVISALDHRFSWSTVSPVVAVVGDVLVALGLFINLVVFRANTYGASNIEVAEGQTVISTGPYGIVRHPMYSGVLIMVVGVPLALGSWWGLLMVMVAVPALVWRVLDEEALLRADLAGYTEYMDDVHYRLVPFIW